MNINIKPILNFSVGTLLTYQLVRKIRTGDSQGMLTSNILWPWSFLVLLAGMGIDKDFTDTNVIKNSTYQAYTLLIPDFQCGKKWPTQAFSKSPSMSLPMFNVVLHTQMFWKLWQKWIHFFDRFCPCLWFLTSLSFPLLTASDKSLKFLTCKACRPKWKELMSKKLLMMNEVNDA